MCDARVAAVAAVAVALGCAPVRADVVRLRNGGELRGTIEAQSTDHLQVRTLLGSRVSVPQSAVHFAVRRTDLEEGYETRLAGTPDGADAHWQLAEWCRLNRLRSEHQQQLEIVLLQDPNHEQARRALGYVRDSGVWKTRDQLMRRGGYVKDGSRYVTRQQRDSISSDDDERKVEVRWTRIITALAARIRNGDPDALEELAGIRDPLAISAMVSFFRNHSSAQVRAVFAATLGQIRHPAMIAPLIEQSVSDEHADVRRIAVSAVPAVYREQAVDELVRYLGSPENKLVERAGGALQMVGDESTAEALIESLVTLHDYSVRSSAAEETRALAADLLNRPDLTPQQVRVVLQAGMTPQRGVPSSDEESNGRVQLLYPHRNSAVLAALSKITGEDFGFDVRAWRLWYRSTK